MLYISCLQFFIVSHFFSFFISVIELVVGMTYEQNNNKSIKFCFFWYKAALQVLRYRRFSFWTILCVCVFVVYIIIILHSAWVVSCHLIMMTIKENHFFFVKTKTIVYIQRIMYCVLYFSLILSTSNFLFPQYIYKNGLCIVSAIKWNVSHL
jgi:hypothetical protein